jgi:hypothetical protein
MAAEYDDLPEAVKKEVQTFADLNVAWLSKVLSAANVVSSEESESRARAIFSAVAGAQLMARSRSDISLYDSLIDSYRAVGLPGVKNTTLEVSSKACASRDLRRPLSLVTAGTRLDPLLPYINFFYMRLFFWFQIC